MSSRSLSKSSKSSSASTSVDVSSQKFPSKTLSSVSDVVAFILEENEKLPNFELKVSAQKKSAFSAKKVPKINLLDYLVRISEYTEVEETTLVLSLVYVDRVCEENGIVLTKYNIHRLLFTSIYLAIKYNEDNYYTFDYYAKIAGISKDELHILENEFVDLIKFDFYVDSSLFAKYQKYLKSFKKTL